VAGRIRVGIISANWGVTAHLPAWRANPDVEVVAICTAHRATAEAAAAAHKIPKVFWDYRKMAEDAEVDVVDVGTRPSLRYDMCMTSLRAGKHGYAGVPFAATIEHAHTLKDAQLKSQRVGVIDAYSEYLPPFVFAKEMIDEGTLGELFSFNCVLQMSLFNTPTSTFPYNWFWDRSYGCSALRNLGSHALNLLYYFFGEIEEVIAQDEMCLKEWRFVDNGQTRQPQVEDTATVLLRLRNGGIGTFSTSWSAVAGPGYMLDLFGSKGRMLLSGTIMPATDTKLFHAKLGDTTLREIPIPDRLKAQEGISMTAAAPGPQFAMALAFAEMVRAIRQGGDARPSFSQGCHVHAVIEAAHKSAQERRWVRPRELH
jgi:predicted dehydrogenase